MSSQRADAAAVAIPHDQVLPVARHEVPARRRELALEHVVLVGIEKGELAPDTRPLDLRTDLLDPMVEQLQPQIDQAGMHVDVEGPGHLAAVGDPTLLRIVVDNLLSNAAKYGCKGGRIVLELGEADGEARLSVWNEGEGVRAEDLPRLFGKFVRLDRPSAEARKGTGLGLFVSREIVERHGGRIWAESEPGQWARFTFTIPTTPA